MQLELSLRNHGHTRSAGPDQAGTLSARDLGYLLHKNPDNVHTRDLASGTAYIFFPEATDAVTTAVLAIDVDPVALVRGRSHADRGLLTQYVNDRPYAAGSFLSVAMAKSFGQSMSGRSKERQALADTSLNFEARIVPVGLAGDLDLPEQLFEPLGYSVTTTLYPHFSRCW